jgi:hypothetical protein
MTREKYISELLLIIEKRTTNDISFYKNKIGKIYDNERDDSIDKVKEWLEKTPIDKIKNDLSIL